MTLLIILLFCHYICDYTDLSTDKMLAAKRIGKPLYPILLHAWVHGLVMLIAMYLYGVPVDTLVVCTLIQVQSHFVIDVLKGRLNTWVPVVANPANRLHWYVFGLDQLLHQLVIVWMCIIAS
jgi:hypothetical protein